MSTHINRRDFLKLAALGLGSMAFRPFFPRPSEIDSDDLARVAIRSVSVYSRPDDTSTILYTRYRDELLHVYYQVVSEFGPGYNPVWYRVWRGWVHSGHLQLVKNRQNEVLSKVPEKFQLAEVTVPWAQAMHVTPNNKRWDPVYRLYYDSVHWIVGIDEGPDGEPWYKLQDELFDTLYHYHVPAAQMRVIPDDEISPLSPEVPAHQKRIEVSISQQTLTAYENEQIVLQTRIASGVPDNRPDPPGGIPTDTPTGSFTVQNKMPSKHMGDGAVTADLDAYELPGVPWTCFFEPKTGVATHGTYWHTNYGLPMSHGCVNLRPEEAKWLFRWTTPQADPHKIANIGMGTRVLVY